MAFTPGQDAMVRGFSSFAEDAKSHEEKRQGENTMDVGVTKKGQMRNYF